MKSLTNDIIKIVCELCDFDDLYYMLFLNKHIYNVVKRQFDIYKKNVKNHKYKNILYEEAIKYEQYILINYLTYLKANYCSKGLITAVELNNKKMVDLMISNGANNFNHAKNLNTTYY